MSVHGSRERVFLEVSVKTRQSYSDDELSPPSREFLARVNDLELSVLFRRAKGPGWWKRWEVFNGDSVSTPWFVAALWADMPFLSQVRVSGDFPKAWWK